MIFTEIALEGVKCFRDQCRFALKPGYNLLWGPNESGKTTLAECIAIVLDPLRVISEEEEYPTWGPPGNSRAGLLITEGNQTFRVTRDFVNGLVSLARLNPQTRKYDVIAQDHAQVDGFLRQQLRIPQSGLWRRIFVLDGKDLPTGRPKVIVQQVAAAPPPAGVPPADAGYGPVPGPTASAPQAPAGYGMSPEEKKRQIEVLKEQLEAARQVGQLQYEIDGLEAKLFEIESKTKDVRSMEDKIEQLKSSLKSLESFNDLPPDIVRRIEFFEEAQREHDASLYDIESRIEKLKKDFTILNTRTPFFKNQFFIGGLAGIIAGLVVFNVVVPKVSALKILPPLMILAGLGLIFWVLWNEFSDRVKETELHKALDKAEEERQEELRKFDVEGSVIRRLMQEAGVEEPKELHSKLKEYKRRKEMVGELEEKLAKTKEESNYERLSRERKEIEEKLDELNRRLRESGGEGFSRDPADIQREIDALQYSIDNPDAPLPPPAAPSPATPAYAPPISATGPTPVPTPAPGGGGGDYLGGSEDDDYLGSGMDYGMVDIGSQPGTSPSYAANADQTVVSGGGGEADVLQAPSAAGGIDTMVDELWAAAEQVSGLDRSTLIMQIADRFNVYVQAFTAKRYSEGDLSSERNLSLRNATGTYTDLKDLTPSTRDAAWLALKIALIENLYQRVRLPVLLDDPLRNLDDTRLAMVSKALKRLGAACQVILLTTHRVHSKIADHTISLVSPGSK